MKIEFVTTGCGKKGFFNRKSAKQFREQTERKYSSQYSIYQCEICGLFHLTTKATVTQNRMYNKKRNERK